MEFSVFSHKGAEAYSFAPSKKNYILISITSVDVAPANICTTLPYLKGILRLTFDDVECNEPNCMTTEDAMNIISFVNTHINDIEKIVVHCGAGVSRSAGTCAALMNIINGDDMEIFNNPKYCPNMHCYRTVLETYYGSYNKEAADAKIKQNIEVWKKAQDL